MINSKKICLENRDCGTENTSLSANERPVLFRIDQSEAGTGWEFDWNVRGLVANLR